MYMTESEYKALLRARSLTRQEESRKATKLAQGVAKSTGTGEAVRKAGATSSMKRSQNGEVDLATRKASVASVAIAKSDTQRLTNADSLVRGKAFERIIEDSCQKYEDLGVACILKTPEPFIVLKRNKEGIFTGRFTGTKAQPDFQGTLSDGRSFLMEAKSTKKDRIMQSALTDTQTALLDKNDKMGAVCLVAVNIQNHYFSVPWKEWKKMKERNGHKYATIEELEEFEIIPGMKGMIYPFLINIEEK